MSSDWNLFRIVSLFSIKQVKQWLEGNLLENLFLVCLAVRSFGGIQELAQKRKNLDYIFDPAIFEKLLVFILLPAL